MNPLARSTLLGALALIACNSSKDMGETVKDAGDVAHDVGANDAATQPGTTSDAGTSGDASSASDAASGAGDASDATDAAVTPGDAGGASAALSSLVYLGGYGTSFPFKTFALDRTSGVLTQQGGAADMGESPTFIAPSFDHHFLYIANESFFNPGVTVASVAADGAVTKLEQQRANGALVFTSLDPSGKYLLAASYDGGFVSVFPVKSDGTLDPAVDTESFMKPASEDSAQTHSVRTSPNGRFAYVPNKALNKVFQFGFDSATGKLSALSPPSISCAGGPRHIAFNESGAYAFVITELSTELVVYRVGDNGALSELQRSSALPAGQTGNAGAHVLVHPNDKFVYASNRTDNSIVVFSLATDGKVALLQTMKSGGDRPRNFDIDSSGKFMVVANQGAIGANNAGTVAVFEIGADGKLTARGAPLTGIDQPAAVSIVNSTAP